MAFLGSQGGSCRRPELLFHTFHEPTCRHDGSAYPARGVVRDVNGSPEPMEAARAEGISQRQCGRAFTSRKRPRTDGASQQLLRAPMAGRCRSHLPHVSCAAGVQASPSSSSEPSARHFSSVLVTLSVDIWGFACESPVARTTVCNRFITSLTARGGLRRGRAGWFHAIPPLFHTFHGRDQRPARRGTPHAATSRRHGSESGAASAFRRGAAETAVAEGHHPAATR